MNIQMIQKDGVLVTRILQKKFDMQNARHFRKKMLSEINSGRTQIVINLSMVEFIDSSGIGAIVSSAKAVRNRGSLVITNPRESVMRIFEMTRLNKVFRIIEDESQAIKLF